MVGVNALASERIMAATSGHLSKLVELAHERSSDKRRELLRQVSELFLGSDEVRGSSSSREITDDILVTLAQNMEASVRAELAERFADHPDAPADLVRDLALDVIEVARPLLARSNVVDDATLALSVRRHGGEHAQVVAARSELSESVAEAVAASHDDQALVTLAHNPGAKLSRTAIEHLVDHAEACPALHEPLVELPEMPPDLLNEMFFLVKEKLRARIVERNQSFDQATLEAAFAAAQQRLANKSGPKPRDYDDAVRYVSGKKLRRKLTFELLGELLVNGERTKFVVAFADMTGLQFIAAQRAIDNPSIDPIAIACRAAGFPKEDFVRVAMLRPTSAAREEADVDALGQLYEAVSVSAADRVMRFVKLRDQGENAA
jgi:uncharacterized protein (DUF2336 family)